MAKSPILIDTLDIKFRHHVEGKKPLQIEVGNVFDVAGAFISKGENNEKPLNREHLSTLSKFFDDPEDELQTLWLANLVRLILDGEPFALSALIMIIKDL